jgi:hypothetical protein
MILMILHFVIKKVDEEAKSSESLIRAFITLSDFIFDLIKKVVDYINLIMTFCLSISHFYKQ